MSGGTTKRNKKVNSFRTTENPITKNVFGTSRPIYYDRHPIFSLKDFKKDSKFYTREHSNADRNCLYNFLHGSKDFCSLTWGHIVSNPRMFHAHGVGKENLNFNDIESELFQFKLPGHDCGRFIGYFDKDAVFNIVVYDRCHNTFKRK